MNDFSPYIIVISYSVGVFGLKQNCRGQKSRKFYKQTAITTDIGEVEISNVGIGMLSVALTAPDAWNTFRKIVKYVIWTLKQTTHTYYDNFISQYEYEFFNKIKLTCSTKYLKNLNTKRSKLQGMQSSKYEHQIVYITMKRVNHLTDF